MAIKKDNKNLIIGICAALIMIAIIIVVVVLVIKNNRPTFGDSYFVSDDTKYVFNVDGSDIILENEEYTPLKNHVVYYHSGDTITGMKSYFEYEDEAKAKAAYNYYKDNLANDYENIELDGKYLILTNVKSDYEDITTYDVEQQIKFIESLNNTNLPEIKEGEEDVKELDAEPKQNEVTESEVETEITE